MSIEFVMLMQYSLDARKCRRAMFFVYLCQYLFVSVVFSKLKVVDTWDPSLRM